MTSNDTLIAVTSPEFSVLMKIYTKARGACIICQIIFAFITTVIVKYHDSSLMYIVNCLIYVAKCFLLLAWSLEGHYLKMLL